MQDELVQTMFEEITSLPVELILGSRFHGASWGVHRRKYLGLFRIVSFFLSDNVFKIAAENLFIGQGCDFYKDELKWLALLSDKCLNSFEEYIEKGISLNSICIVNR